MTCTFFGHRDTPDSVKRILEKTVRDLIENRGVDNFYVGNHGRFDVMVYSVLKQMKKEYPHIRFAVVLAYMPVETEEDNIDYNDTLYPDGLENTPKRFAISHRNRWMLNNADMVIAYVAYSRGGAWQGVRAAKGQGKTVINLANMI